MKKIIQLLYILFAVAAFSACSDDNQGEVVSQDLSYQLDANYVFVDIPEKFLFDPSNILYLEGKTVMKLNAKSDGKQTTITEGTEFTFNVKLKKALNQNVKVRLKKNLDLLEGHTLTEFPDEAFELNDAIITAGSREGTITLNITNPDIEQTTGIRSSTSLGICRCSQWSENIETELQRVNRDKSQIGERQY